MRKLDRTEYDSKEGIRRFLKHYPSFLAIIEERRKAHQERGERLNSFIVLGAFSFDAFGQVGKLTPSPKVNLRDIPDIMDTDAFYEYLGSTPWGDRMLSTVFSPVHIPPLNMKCAGCGTYYGVGDCHDVVAVQMDSDLISLVDFVGRQLWELRWHFKKDHTIDRFIRPSSIIRNDRFIDERIEPYFDSTSQINKYGWVGEGDGITDAYVIQAGDETRYQETRYFHVACFIPWKVEESRKWFYEVLSKVGFEKFSMESVDNKYGSFQYNGSWFVVTTPEGSFTIGWRKRVVEITLNDWPVDCSTLFAGEDVTVGKQMIHAWSREKVIEYLQVILKEASKEFA